MSILKGSKKGFIGTAVVYIIIGILMCAWPIGVSNLLCFIAGAVLVVNGLWRAIRYFRAGEYGFVGRADFAAGALQAFLGLLLMRRPYILTELTPILLGAMVLVNSVFQVQVALELKKIKYGRWQYYLAISLVCAAVALTMMFNPFQSYKVLSIIMGAAFIVDGAVDLWTALYVTKALKRLNLM